LRFPIALLLTAASAPAERATPFYQDKQNLLYYLDARGGRVEIRSKSSWSRRRAHVMAGMERVMGRLPRIDHALPPAIEVIREVRTEKYTWRRIIYQAEPGDRPMPTCTFPTA